MSPLFKDQDLNNFMNSVIYLISIMINREGTFPRQGFLSLIQNHEQHRDNPLCDRPCSIYELFKTYFSS